MGVSYTLDLAASSTIAGGLAAAVKAAADQLLESPFMLNAAAWPWGRGMWGGTSSETRPLGPAPGTGPRLVEREGMWSWSAGSAHSPSCLACVTASQGREISTWADGVLCSRVPIGRGASVLGIASFAGCLAQLRNAVKQNNGTFKLQAMVTRPGSTVNPQVSWTRMGLRFGWCCRHGLMTVWLEGSATC